jgi:hypothetical protein
LQDRYAIDVKDVLLEVRDVRRKVADLVARVNVLDGMIKTEEEDDNNNGDILDDGRSENGDDEEEEGDGKVIEDDKEDENDMDVVRNEEDEEIKAEKEGGKEIQRDVGTEGKAEEEGAKDIQSDVDAQSKAEGEGVNDTQTDVNVKEKAKEEGVNASKFGDGRKIIVQALMALNNPLACKLKAKSRRITASTRLISKAKHKNAVGAKASKKMKLRKSKMIAVDDMDMARGAMLPSFQFVNETLCRRVMAVADEDDARAIRWILNQPLTS